MKSFRTTAVSLLIFAVSLGAITTPAQDAKSPGQKLNVLFIVADDLNCQLGCYGNTIVKTPNIDRLAARGVRFDRAYCNYPVCNASRTSFLSGRYPDTTRIFGNGAEPRTALGKDFQFLPEYYKSQGYFTAGIGKIAHGSFPESIKWDVFAEPMKGEDEDTTTAKAVRGAKRAAKQASKSGVKEVQEPVPFTWAATTNADEIEPDGVTARKVAKLLEEHKDKPFFIAAGFHKPHVPHTAPKKYFDLYALEKMPLPQEPTDHTKGIPAIARPPKYFPDLNDQQKQGIVQHYYAATSFMDAQLGVILETMDRLKLWDNTVVIFLGDHGWHHGEHGGFWAKMSIMEESAHAPLILYAPGRKSGESSQRLVEFVDIFPTLATLSGLTPPPGLQGRSIIPLLDDPKRAWDETAYSVVSRQGGLGRSVRDERFTYIEWPDASVQLYDYSTDPKEYVNLAKEPQYADTVARMKTLLTKREHDATPAGANPNDSVRKRKKKAAAE